MDVVLVAKVRFKTLELGDIAHGELLRMICKQVNGFVVERLKGSQHFFASNEFVREVSVNDVVTFPGEYIPPSRLVVMEDGVSQKLEDNYEIVIPSSEFPFVLPRSCHDRIFRVTANYGGIFGCIEAKKGDYLREIEEPGGSLGITVVIAKNLNTRERGMFLRKICAEIFINQEYEFKYIAVPRSDLHLNGSVLGKLKGYFVVEFGKHFVVILNERCEMIRYDRSHFDLLPFPRNISSRLSYGVDEKEAKLLEIEIEEQNKYQRFELLYPRDEEIIDFQIDQKPRNTSVYEWVVLKARENVEKRERLLQEALGIITEEDLLEFSKRKERYWEEFVQVWKGHLLEVESLASRFIPKKLENVLMRMLEEPVVKEMFRVKSVHKFRNCIAIKRDIDNEYFRTTRVFMLPEFDNNNFAAAVFGGRDIEFDGDYVVSSFSFDPILGKIIVENSFGHEIGHLIRDHSFLRICYRLELFNSKILNESEGEEQSGEEEGDDDDDDYNNNNNNNNNNNVRRRFDENEIERRYFVYQRSTETEADIIGIFGDIERADKKVFVEKIALSQRKKAWKKLSIDEKLKRFIHHPHPETTMKMFKQITDKLRKEKLFDGFKKKKE